jgi:predicted nucleotidyltransferase
MGKEFVNEVKEGKESVVGSGEAIKLPRLESALIKTLLYFDIFKYPLKEDELLRACGVDLPERKTGREAIQNLVERNKITCEGAFFFVGKGEGYVERRIRGNELAEQRMVKARKVSRFIGSFPYVRAVMLSGSLSKNYMEPDSDIDYFIVTEPGRLWVARTMLILYKKIVLFNSHRNFCVNYFVDTDHLDIEDRNIFTATEVIYLLPTYNRKIYQHFRENNSWADEIFPNFGKRDTKECHVHRRSLKARVVEYILKGALGERLDAWCMSRTFRRWEKKFPHLDSTRFEISLRTRKYVSKHHPQDYQKRVLDALSLKIKDFEGENVVKL